MIRLCLLSFSQVLYFRKESRQTSISVKKLHFIQVFAGKCAVQGRHQPISTLVSTFPKALSVHKQHGISIDWEFGSRYSSNSTGTSSSSTTKNSIVRVPVVVVSVRVPVVVVPVRVPVVVVSVRVPVPVVVVSVRVPVPVVVVSVRVPVPVVVSTSKSIPVVIVVVPVVDLRWKLDCVRGRISLPSRSPS